MAISDFLSVAKSLKDFWQFLRDTIAMAHYSHWLRVNSDQHDRKRRVPLYPIWEITDKRSFVVSAKWNIRKLDWLLCKCEQ